MRKLVVSASFNALSNGGDIQDIEMVKGIDCNCPDNCNDVIYNQVIRKDCVLWYENLYSGNVKWSLSRYEWFLLEKCSRSMLQPVSLTQRVWKRKRRTGKSFWLHMHRKVRITLDEKYIIVTYLWLWSLLKRKIGKSSLVHVYFKNLGVTKFTKDRLFGWADLICKITF